MIAVLSYQYWLISSPLSFLALTDICYIFLMGPTCWQVMYDAFGVRLHAGRQAEVHFYTSVLVTLIELFLTTSY